MLEVVFHFFIGDSQVDPGESSGNAGRRAYKYEYDKSDRLKTSSFSMYSTAAWDKESGTLNENMSYDHNGNILTLTRTRNQRGSSGLTATSTAQTMDQLAYTYASGSGNKLTKVDDSGNTMGFNNLTSQTTEYNYDSDGNLVEDKNKGISAITYNFLGKPQQMTFTDGRVITYAYSASGTKLSMSVTQSGNTTTTNYADSYVYQGTALSFFGSPAGRVVKNGSNLDYEYALTDHQGNTRVLFTSATPQAQTFAADMEATTNGDFQNYPSGGNRSSLNEFDHTDAGTTATYSNLLNAGYSSRIGVGKSFKVYPGDKVKIEAYAKYSEISGSSSNLTGFATSLLAAFGQAPPGVGETGTASAALDNYGSIVAGGGGVGENGFPKVFVNILVFDKNYSFLDVAWEQINGGAETLGGSVNPHDYMSREYTATKEGYVYLFVSNESATQIDAYFDDVTITLTPNNIVQYNEYYPFGLNTEESWTRENVTGNNFQYNEATEKNPTTGYYDLFFRNFDPTLGRFMQVDPLASRYHNQSTYQYANNDPVYWTDPSGAFAEYESATGGGCGCWRDSGAQDASAGMYGVSFEKYASGGSIWESNGNYGQDAAAARSGQMSLSEYAAKYGTTFTVGRPIFGPEYYYNAKGDTRREIVGYDAVRKNKTKGNGPGASDPPEKKIEAGVGSAFSIGGGALMQGLEFTIGGWGAPGSTGQVFFSIGVPKNPVYLNWSYSGQVILVKSRAGEKADVSGKGMNAGVGVGPISGSYGQSYNDQGQTTTDIYGLGTGAGIKYSGGMTKTQTWAIDTWSPLWLITLLPSF